MPMLCEIGKKIGVKRSKAGVKSINNPTMSKTMLIIMIKTIGLDEMPNMNVLSAVGIPVNAITHDITDEAAIKNITTLVVIPASTKIFGNFFILMVR